MLLHRGHEHADRWDSVVPGLAMPETAIFAWDARGHGESEGKRGHASCFMQYVRDLAEFIAHIAKEHGLTEDRIVLVAHSVGAVIAATWVHDYAPQLAGLVLATPAFDVNLIVPGALTSIRLMLKVKPDAIIKSYVQGEWLTRDAAAAAEYDTDTKISKDISAQILVELFDTSQRIIADAMVMDRPLLFFSATADRVVTRDSLNRFFAFGIVSLAYARRDARFFGRENGTLTPAAEWCLLPWMLLGRAFQHRYLNGPPSRQIAPGILLGRRHTTAEAEALLASGPLAVLDLRAEGNAPAAFRERAVFCNIPLLDMVPPTAGAVGEALEFIRTQQPERTVLVHCQLGLFRSATVMAAWLVEYGAAPDYAAAVEHLRAIDPRVRPAPEPV